MKSFTLFTPNGKKWLSTYFCVHIQTGRESGNCYCFHKWRGSEPKKCLPIIFKKCTATRPVSVIHFIWVSRKTSKKYQWYFAISMRLILDLTCFQVKTTFEMMVNNSTKDLFRARSERSSEISKNCHSNSHIHPREIKSLSSVDFVRPLTYTSAWK